MWAGGQWRVSILGRASLELVRDNKNNVKSRTLHQMPSALLLSSLFSSVSPATSLQWWTTEEECLVMAHSCCTRYVHHIVSRYDIWNIWSEPSITTPPFSVFSWRPQGLQRRITVTIVHESGGDMEWKDIRELVVGEFGYQLFLPRKIKRWCCLVRELFSLGHLCLPRSTPQHPRSWWNHHWP